MSRKYIQISPPNAVVHVTIIPGAFQFLLLDPVHVKEKQTTYLKIKHLQTLVSLKGVNVGTNTGVLSTSLKSMDRTLLLDFNDTDTADYRHYL